MDENERLSIHSQVQQKLNDEKRKAMNQLAGVPDETPSPFVENGKQLPPTKNYTDISDASVHQIKEVVGDAFTAGAIGQMNEPTVQIGIKQNAQKAIKTEVNRIGNRLAKDEQDAVYDANAEACKDYGINKAVPTWQVKLMKAGDAVWFCIYWVFGTLVICPINVFAKGLRAFIKRGWVVVALAVLIWLLIVLSPLIGIWISKLVAWGSAAGA